MSYVVEVCDTALRSIDKRRDTADLSDLRRLASDYKHFANFLYNQKKRSHNLAVNLVHVTEGPAVNAFENYAHDLNVTIRHLHRQTLEMSDAITELADAIFVLRSVIRDKRAEVESIRAVAANESFGLPSMSSVTAIKKVHTLVRDVIQSHENTVNAAERYGKKFAGNLDDITLPKRGGTWRSPDLVFKGGYTIRVKTDQVRHAAEGYQGISDDVYDQREKFSHTGRLDSAPGTGDDEIAGAFYRAGWGSLSALCRNVSQVAHGMKYINNGLRAMADSHDNNEEAAQARLDRLKDTLDNASGVTQTFPREQRQRGVGRPPTLIQP